MNKFAASMIVLSCMTTLAGCAEFLGDPSSPSPVSGFSVAGQKASSPLQFTELEDWLARNNLAITTGRDRNDYDRSFSQGSVIAYGEGAPSREAHNGAQKRLTAQRAAEVAAQRNLADFFADHARFGELRMISYTVKLDAFLQGATTVASDYDTTSERAAVLVKLDLRGARGFAP